MITLTAVALVLALVTTPARASDEWREYMACLREQREQPQRSCVEESERLRQSMTAFRLRPREQCLQLEANVGHELRWCDKHLRDRPEAKQ